MQIVYVAASNETKYATVFVALVTVSSFPILSGILREVKKQELLNRDLNLLAAEKNTYGPLFSQSESLLGTCPSFHISKSQQANWWEEDEAHLGPSARLLPRLGTHPGLTPAPPCKDLTGSAEAPMLLEG